MSRSSSNSAKSAVFLALLLLASASALGQTPNPPGGSSGGGTGCTTAGSNGDVLTDNGAGGCNSDGSATLAAGALGLGSSGVVGTVTLGNATSGTVALGTVAGALGTVTASLPANSGTLAELNLAQSWSAIQTFGNGDLKLSGSSSGSSILEAPATGGGIATLPAGAGTLLYQALADGDLFVGSAGGVATAKALSGDCTLVNSGAITCTKTNGSAFVASATTDTTNATNITSGTLPNARIVALPNSALANSATTVNGQTCTLGSTCTVTAAATGVTVGTTTITTGTTNGLLYDNAGVLGNLATANSGVLVTSGAGAPSISTTLPNMNIGTPTAGVGTNLTALNASNLSSGTVAAARGGAGIINGALKGNGSGTVSQAACADLSDSGTACTATTPTGPSCTATLTFSGGTTGLTQTDTCNYAKFGSLQNVTIGITVTALGSASGNASITVSGPTNQNSNSPATCSMQVASMTLTGSPQAVIGTGSTTILLRQQTSGANAVLTNSNFSSSSAVNLSCTMVN